MAKEYGSIPERARAPKKTKRQLELERAQRQARSKKPLATAKKRKTMTRQARKASRPLTAVQKAGIAKWKVDRTTRELKTRPRGNR
jgi:hypothetical protein